MNLDQVLSILRLLLGVSGPIGALLVARGMSPDQVTVFSTALLSVIGALPPIISGVWGLFAHTDAAKVTAAAAVPGVQAVVVKTSATDGVAKAAADPEQPKVISAVAANLPVGALK